MNILNRKLLRTIRATLGQFIALAAVVMVGVVIYIALTTAFYNLSRSQNLFYQENDFADYYFHVVNAPEGIIKQVEAVPGVIKATGRIQKDVAVLKAKNERASARLTTYSLPMDKELNRLYLLNGKSFAQDIPAGNSINILMDPQYVQANHLETGDKIEIIAGDKKIALSITGTATSPEFIYIIKDGANMFPDPKSFGIIMIDHEEAQQILNMKGQINQIIIKLAPGADEKLIARQIEDILKPYGNLVSYPQRDQLSDAAMNMEIDGLRTSSTYLPLIFFLVAAGIQFLLLNRLIKSQRLQIGVLKALGYNDRQIISHFMGYALMVSVTGTFLGIVIGMGLASLISGMYAQFFNLPQTIGGINLKAVVYSIFLTTTVGGAAGYFAARGVSRINAAQAMNPEPPRIGKKTFIERWEYLWNKLHSSWKMSLRSISRNRARFAVTVLGTASAVALLVLSLFSSDSFDYMLKQHFSYENAYDYMVHFDHPVREDEILSWSRWEGVYKVEAQLEIPVKIYGQGKEDDDLIIGLEQGSSLKNIVNERGAKLSISEEGILLNEQIAKKLDLQVGDKLEIETKMSTGPSYRAVLKVRGLNKQLMGGGSFVSLQTANRILGEKQLISSVMLLVNSKSGEKLEERLNNIIGVSAVLSREKEKANTLKLLDSMIYFISIMVLFAVILGLAIVYNSSIMSFNERKRELASLLVIGLSKREISSLLFKETLIQVIFAIVLGLPLGRILGEMYIAAVSTDLYTMPIIIYPRTYLLSAIGAIVFVFISSMLVTRKVKGLEMIEVLKNRE